MSFVSDQQGFALGTVHCGTGRCVALFSTPDGGISWRRLTAPTKGAGAVYGTCPSRRPCVQQVRFATPLIGYAYDPSLLVTSDGGLHWRLLGGVGVDSLETANGTVVRVVSGTTGCAGAPARVESAPLGTTSWQALPAPPIEMICPPVLYRQGQRLVLAGYGNPAGGVRATAEIDRSANGGQTWATGPDKCGGKDGYASAVALAPPDVLVLLCQHQMPRPSGVFGPAWIRISANGGATFGPDHLVRFVPAPRGTIIHYELAAASSARVLVLSTDSAGRSRVVLTENAGRTWTTTLTLPAGAAPVLVGYEDPLTARAAQGDTVWTTRTGGRTWTANHIT